jgi:hypothetical protein
LVGLDSGEATVMPLARSGPTTIDAAAFDRLYLVVVNTTPVEAETDCGYHNYTVALADAAAFTLIKAPPVPDDPGLYTPPVQTNLFGEGQPISAGDAPFTPLYPGYLPPGYDFTQMVSYTIADLGELAPDYAPGGEPVLALEYSGNAPDTYISITQNPTMHKSVWEWVYSREYSANDVRLVNNKPVYLLDYSEGIDPFSSATFVHHNLFIVIDGTVDPIDLQHITADFIAHNP